MALFGPPNIDRLAAQQDVQGLTEALGYRADFRVRLSAAQALGQIGPEATPALVAALQDPVPDVSRAAAAALSKFGASAVPFLIPLLQDENPEMVAEAARALKRVGGMAVPALISAVGDDTYRGPRSLPAELLAATADLQSVPVLRAALDSPKPGVRWAARTAMRRVGVNEIPPTFSGRFAVRLSHQLAGFPDPDEPGTWNLTHVGRHCDRESRERFERHQTALREVLDERTRRLSDHLMPHVEFRTITRDRKPAFTVEAILEATPPNGTLADIPAMLAYRLDSSALRVIVGPRLVRIVGDGERAHLLAVFATKTIKSPEGVKSSTTDPRTIVQLLESDEEKRRTSESYGVELFTVPEHFDPSRGLAGLPCAGLERASRVAVYWPIQQSGLPRGLHNSQVERVVGAVDLVLENAFTPVLPRGEGVPEWEPTQKADLSESDRAKLDKRSWRLRETDVPLW